MAVPQSAALPGEAKCTGSKGGLTTDTTQHNLMINAMRLVVDATGWKQVVGASFEREVKEVHITYSTWCDSFNMEATCHNDIDRPAEMNGRLY